MKCVLEHSMMHSNAPINSRRCKGINPCLGVLTNGCLINELIEFEDLVAL